MSPGLSENLLSRLADFATGRLGLRFPPDRWGELARAVHSAALALGVADVEGWAESLAQGGVSEESLQALADHLTVVETYFFRHRDTFTHLAERILPARLETRRAEMRPLRLWSAACSSGEEPYSLAILLDRMLGPGADRIVVRATDINSLALGRAARGLFTEWSFRDAPDWLKPSYFTRRPMGRLELSREIRRRVKFTRLNLVAPIYPPEFGERGDFDVILCRNALMYFSSAWQETVLRRLVQALAPEGWLLVGPCDLSPGLAESFGLVCHAPGLFQRRAGARGQAPARALPAVESGFAIPQSLLPAAPPALPATAMGLPAVFLEQPAEPPSESRPAPVQSAWTRADRGELAEALADCDAVLRTEKLEPSWHYLRGCILEQLGRMDEARSAFQRVLFLEPDAVMAQFSLGALAVRQGELDEARRCYGQVLRLLRKRGQGDAVPGGDGLTVGRLSSVVEYQLRRLVA